MEPKKKLILKPGKEKPVKNRHHWIFSGAIARLPEHSDGEIIQVCSSSGEALGYAYINSRVSIVGRMISFDAAPPDQSIKKSIADAIALRHTLFSRSRTNAYRLINGEGDALPGLVVDRYRDVLVIQIMTLGMDKLRPLILSELIQQIKPKAIYEKSTHGSRLEEGLDITEGTIYGPDADVIEIMENGFKFHVSLKQGQKTGFFLDQREMRKKVMELSEGKRVLNCFSYTGGFSVYALAGGAIAVDSVDSSEHAVSYCDTNVSINGFDKSMHCSMQQDVFEFLKKDSLNYGLVILDPPAFAKGKKDVMSACRGYKEINRRVLNKMPKGSFLLTCSCSGYVDTELFQKVIFQAAAEANRHVRIIGRHEIARDHPINLFHPETEYLKSLVLYLS